MSEQLPDNPAFQEHTRRQKRDFRWQLVIFVVPMLVVACLPLGFVVYPRVMVRLTSVPAGATFEALECTNGLRTMKNDPTVCDHRGGVALVENHFHCPEHHPRRMVREGRVRCFKQWGWGHRVGFVRAGERGEPAPMP